MRKKLLAVRAIERLVNLPSFIKVFENRTDEEKEVLFQLVSENRKNHVFSWFERYLGLDEKTVKQLRELAKAAGVVNYHHLNKEELVRELNAGNAAKSIASKDAFPHGKIRGSGR